jgi:DNA-binding response OmpR family regulator
MSRALLLADAERGTREFLERHLASEGFEVLGAHEEREALELAERMRPDLILLGALQDAAGVEVCRRLREGAPGRSWDRNVPVIVLGEPRDDAVDRVRAFERGCDDFVTRPFH